MKRRWIAAGAAAVMTFSLMPGTAAGMGVVQAAQHGKSQKADIAYPPKAHPQAAPDSGSTAQKTSTHAAVVLTVSAPSPAVYGDTVHLAAQIKLTRLGAGGTVTFLDGGVPIATSPVDSSGAASFDTTTLSAGKHSFVATYVVGGTSSSSSAVGLTIAKRSLRLYALPDAWARPMGAPNPGATVQLVPGDEGDLVNGDTLATAVRGKPKFSFPDSSVTPSLYAIGLSGLKSSNYDLVYRSAHMVVYTADLKVGDAVPDLTGLDQNDASFSLSSLRGRVVLLDFSAVWCPPSAWMASESSAIADALDQQGIPFTYLPVLIEGATGGSPATQQDATYYTKHYSLPAGTHVLHVDGQAPAVGSPLPALTDAFYSYGFAAANGGLAYPTLAYIDADGILRQVDIGYMGKDATVAGLAAIAPDTGVDVTSRPPSFSSSTDATVEFSVTNGGAAQCRLDDGAYAPCTSPYTVTGLSDGAHRIEISAGAEWPATITWSVETAPDTTITSGPGGETMPIFTFTGSPTTASFRCWIDDQAAYACASPAYIFNIPGGDHTFHVASVNGDGVSDPTPATASFTTQQLPTITLTRDIATPTAGETVTWTATLTDATTGDPVTAGQVSFYTSAQTGSVVDIAPDGTAQFSAPVNGSLSVGALYLGSALYGAAYAEDTASN